MNDRGKPLSPIDMLKAYLLAPIEDDAERSDANRVWKQTVLDLISWGGDPEPERDAALSRPGCAPSMPKRSEIARPAQRTGTGNSSVRRSPLAARQRHPRRRRYRETEPSHHTGEFPFFAGAYRLILDASKTYTRGLEPVFYNAHNDFTWQSTVLLAPLTVGDSDQAVYRKLAATATYLDIWVMRRTANYIRVGYSSVSYAMFMLCRTSGEVAAGSHRHSAGQARSG